MVVDTADEIGEEATGVVFFVVALRALSARAMMVVATSRTRHVSAYMAMRYGLGFVMVTVD